MRVLPVQRAVQDFAVVIPATLGGTVEVDNDQGFCSVGMEIVPPTAPGKVIFEGSYDGGTTWREFTLRRQTTDDRVQQTSAVDAVRGSISAFRKWRIRTVIAGAAAGAATGRMSREVDTLEDQEFAPAPHRLGNIPFHVDKHFTGTQPAPGTVLWSPGPLARFRVTSYFVGASGATDATVSLFDESDVEGRRMFRAFLDVSVNFGIQHTRNPNPPFSGVALGSQLRLISSAAIDLNLIIDGYPDPSST